VDVADAAGLAHLHNGDHVGETRSIDVDRTKQDEELVRRRVRHELQVVGRVLVV